MRRTIPPQERVDLADVAAAAGDSQLAVQHLAQAVIDDPTSYNYVRLGGAYRRCRDLGRAAESYSKAMMQAATEGRENPAAHTGLAFVYIDAGYPDRAVAHCLESALSHGTDYVGLKIIASGYEALYRRDRNHVYARRAQEIRERAAQRFSPNVEMDRRALRLERMLRGHVAEVRDALSHQDASDRPQPSPSSRVGSSTQPGIVRFVSPN